MDERSTALLEYPEVRARLASYAAFAPSRRLAEALTPSPDPVVVRRRLDETDEARWLLGERPDIGIGGARDVGAHVERAARGGRLEPTELLAIGETLNAASRLTDGLREQPKPLLHDLYRSIAPLPSLRVRLETAIEPGGRDRWTAPHPSSGACAAACGSRTSASGLGSTASSTRSSRARSRSRS